MREHPQRPGRGQPRRWRRAPAAGARFDGRGRRRDGSFDHKTGRGWVKAVKGDYFDAIVRKGSRVVPMIIETTGGIAPHSRAVVGVSRGRLVLLDPAWRAPQLECVSAEDLASRASRFEILVVRPGVRDASTHSSHARSTGRFIDWGLYLP